MRPYWDSEFETMDTDSLLRLENTLLAEQFAYVMASSPFYQQKFAEIGEKGHLSVRSREALAELPFTDKQELVAAQSGPLTLGSHQCAPNETVVRIAATGGTSGRPLLIGWADQDIMAYNQMGARALWCLGIRPVDSVVNCFNYRLYAGGVMDHHSFETVGASVIAYGVGQSHSLLELLGSIRNPVGLYSTPSYALNLLKIAEHLHIDVKQLGVSKGVFSGEVGLQSPSVRQQLESGWGLRAGDLYGIAELGCQAAECQHRTGLHFFGSGFVLAELIDPKDGTTKEWRDGEEGELVFTSLQRKACPLIRWRTHDLVRIHTNPCACGRRGFRFNVLGRTDHMIVVKGVNVFPTSIQAVLLEIGYGLTGEFRIVIDEPFPLTHSPRLVVERLAVNAPPDDYVRQIAAAELKRRLGVSFSLEIETTNQPSPQSNSKAKRIVFSHGHQAALEVDDVH